MKKTILIWTMIFILLNSFTLGYEARYWRVEWQNSNNGADILMSEFDFIKPDGSNITGWSPSHWDNGTINPVSCVNWICLDNNLFPTADEGYVSDSVTKMKVTTWGFDLGSVQDVEQWLFMNCYHTGSVPQPEYIAVYSSTDNTTWSKRKYYGAVDTAVAIQNGTYHSCDLINMTDFDEVAPSGDVAVSLISPTNDTINSSTTLNLTYKQNFSNAYLLNTTLWINSTGTWRANQTNTTEIINNSINNFEINLTDGTYLWAIGLWDNNTNLTMSNNFTLIIDTIDPLSTTDGFISSNKSFFRNLLIGQINASDPNLFEINTYIDNIEVDNITNIAENNYIYNLSINITNVSVGVHNLVIKIIDGHTGEKLKEMKDPIIKSGGLEFRNKEEYFKITPNDYDLFNKISYKKEENKYTFTYEKRFLGKLLTSKDKVSFYVESNKNVYIPKNKDSRYNGWVVIPDIGENGRWTDFNLKNAPDAKYEMKQLNNGKVKIDISDIPKDLDKLEFESGGELNFLTLNYTFYKYNYTISYVENILGTTPRTYNFNITRNSTYITDADTIINLNGTEYPLTKTIYPTSIFFTRTFTNTYTTNDFNLTFNFTYNVTGNESFTNHTEYFNQSVLVPSIDFCNAAHPYHLFNITYKDQVTNADIDASNEYALTFYTNGTTINKTDIFTPQGNHTLCTSLSPDLINNSWDMYGTMQLNASSYSNKFLQIDPSAPYVLNNSMARNITNYLILASNGSSITFNWLNTQFQQLTGTMLVYICNPDGTKSLIESVAVVSGTTSVNLDIYSNLYSYNIIVGGVTYSEASYATCHLETPGVITNGVTYYVDQTESTSLPLIGLYLTKCSLKKIDNNTANMSWTLNAQSSETIQGCLIAYRGSNLGRTKIYENCSNSSPILRTIPDNSNPYYVVGELRQDTYTVPCGQTLDFFTERDSAKSFGLMGIFAVILMVAAFSLLLLGRGDGTLLGAGAGLIISWFIGLVSWGWETTSLLCAFLLLVGITARYCRKPK